MDITADAEALWTECHKALVAEKLYALGVPMANFIKVEFTQEGIIEVTVPKKSDVVLLSNRENLNTIEQKLESIADKPLKVHIVCNDNSDGDDIIIGKLKEILGEDTLKIIK